MNKLQFSKYFDEVTNFHDVKGIPQERYDRYFKKCQELGLEIWQWQNICKKLMDNENVYTGKLPQVGRIEHWYDQLGYGKAYDKGVKKTAGVKCGGHGTISIKARIINDRNQIISVGGWSCPCENGDRFRQSKVPFKNFFDRFGKAISKNKLIVKDGRLEYQDGVEVVIKTQRINGKNAYIGLVDRAEIEALQAPIVQKHLKELLARVGNIPDAIKDGITTGNKLSNDELVPF